MRRAVVAQHQSACLRTLEDHAHRIVCKALLALKDAAGAVSTPVCFPPVHGSVTKPAQQLGGVAPDALAIALNLHYHSLQDGAFLYLARCEGKDGAYASESMDWVLAMHENNFPSHCALR